MYACSRNTRANQRHRHSRLRTCVRGAPARARMLTRAHARSPFPARKGEVVRGHQVRLSYHRSSTLVSVSQSVSLGTRDRFVGWLAIAAD